jgi:flagellar biosynthesis protein FliR
MRGDVAIPAQTLTAFLLVMARMGGLLLFIPAPGVRQGPEAAKIVFSAAAALTMVPFWWHQPGPIFTEPGHFLAAMLAEAALGTAIGLAVALLAESLIMAAQMISLQAGYSYASTIDPTTEAEAGYLLVVAQLLAGLLFFSCGIDRQLLAALAGSFTRLPPGTFPFSASVSGALLSAGSLVFSTGLRLALPVVALLIMTDMTLALLGRLNSQLQVTQLAFPAKMLAGLALLAWIATLIPVVFRETARSTLETIQRLFG